MSNVWSFETKSKKLAQVTKFPYFDVKSMDANNGAVVFEQAGEIHELDPKTGRDKIVSITANGDFPWMMARWEDVTARMSNLGLSPTGKRVVVEARGEIFTIPAEKGDVRNLSTPAGPRNAIRPGPPTEVRLVLQRQVGRVQAANRVAGRDRAAARDHARQPVALLHAVLVARLEEALYTDTNLNVWVMDVESGKAKIVGRDPWMVPQRTVNPVWSPISKWIAYAAHLNSLYKAIFITQRGDR